MSRALLSALLTASLLLVGCGSSNTSSTSSTPTATGTTPSAPPPAGGSTGGSTGGSSGGSGGTTGGGSEQPRTWEESLFATGSFGTLGVADVNSPTASGPMIGHYSLTLAGGTNDGSSIVGQFCPFAVQGCITLPDSPTFRNSGGIQIAGTFPSHGTYSGQFIINRNGVETWATGFSLPSNGSAAWGSGSTPWSAQLVRAAALSSGLGAQAQFGTGTDPLTDGTLTVTQPDATVHPSVTGASPNTAYTVSYCNPSGASCTALGTLTTDGSGNGSAALSISPIVKAGDINSGQFKLSRNGASGPVEFVTGFIIP